MPRKLFPVNETVWKAVMEEKGAFTKRDILKKLIDQEVCPYPIAENTVKRIISSMVSDFELLEVVSAGVGRGMATRYRLKNDDPIADRDKPKSLQVSGTIVARKCPHCGHHEIGVETGDGEFVPVRPGYKVQIHGGKDDDAIG